MLLEARDITAGYGEKSVLEGVSIQLAAGEFVGLIGPNGCGKSTLLRVLSNILPPRRGHVSLDGQPIASWPAIEMARRLGFVPQQETAAFDFTVREIVLMGRYPHRQRFRGERADDYAVVARALAETDLLALAERPVTQLSGGEHRRVLLARALAQQTPLLLLDEPTAHLDLAHQAELLTLVRRLVRQQGVGAMAALHDLNQAAEYCDRLALMQAGRILRDGPPETVLTAENLRFAYGAETQVGRNPVTGHPMLLTAYPARDRERPEATPRVHLVCGGGSGIGVMSTLLRHGFQVTTGVLNRLDRDQGAAEALGIVAALEAPFSPIGPEARQECAALMGAAQFVLVTEVPFGPGNLANLELTVEAQSSGKQVLLLGSDAFDRRDYAGGAATALFDRLLQNGACRYARLEDWPGLAPTSTLAIAPVSTGE